MGASAEPLSEMPPVAFYCVTGADFFPGAVALLNSLRLHGHEEPFFVLDCGMHEWQRELLAPHATVVPAGSEAAPSLLKLELPLARPATTMVLLDADVIVTRPLTELIESASAGALVAFENDRPRYFAEWSRLLELPQPRRAPYVTTCALFASEEVAGRVFGPARERQLSADLGATWLGEGAESDPLYYLDQDVLNAVAASLLREDEIEILDVRLSATPPFQGLRLVDTKTLRCRYRDGSEPYLLHHWAGKPWLVPVRGNVYTRLLTRLLLGPDVAVKMEPQRLPLRLRTGVAAEAERLRLKATLTVPGLRRRLRRTPPRIKAWPS